MAISIDQVKKLREETSAPVLECQKALEVAGGDMKKAFEYLKQKGMERAEKKASREVKAGLIECYVHQTGKVGAMIEILCETDFVALNEEFKNLAHEVAMQVASMDPKNVEELLKQDYIRDGSKTIDALVKEAIGKIGENIVVSRIHRFELGL